MLLLAWVAAQTAAMDQFRQELDASLSKVEIVQEQAFDCMEKGTKNELISRLGSSAPENIVDSALNECNHLKIAFVGAAKSTYIPPNKAAELADRWFNTELRQVYIGLVEKWFIEPKIAESRLKIAINLWRNCVDEKATDWSRLNDDAATIASASLTACHESREGTRSAYEYALRSKSLPANAVTDGLEKLDATMKNVAIERIVSSRASRLPKN